MICAKIHHTKAIVKRHRFNQLNRNYPQSLKTNRYYSKDGVLDDGVYHVLVLAFCPAFGDCSVNHCNPSSCL